MGKIPPAFDPIISQVSSRLSGSRFAFRGTTSLYLQGLDFNVADIDLLADSATALACNQLLSSFVVQPVVLRRTDKHLSYFGQFSISDTAVEVMGEWSIKNSQGTWIGPFTAAPDEIITISYQNLLLPVTSFATELRIYAALGRWSVFHKLKRTLQLPP